MKNYKLTKGNLISNPTHNQWEVRISLYRGLVLEQTGFMLLDTDAEVYSFLREVDKSRDFMSVGEKLPLLSLLFGDYNSHTGKEGMYVDHRSVEVAYYDDDGDKFEYCITSEGEMSPESIMVKLNSINV